MAQGMLHWTFDLGSPALRIGFHDVMALFLGQCGGHQWVFQCLHNGVGQTIPSVMYGNMLGSNSICPFVGLGKEELKLVGLITIWPSHGSQQFMGFVGFKTGDGCGSPVGAQGEGQLT
jgi:hypothetical protein